MTPTERAEKLARYLFTDGTGLHWTHLSINNAADLGWGEGPVRDCIQRGIESAVTEAQAEMVERAAEAVEELGPVEDFTVTLSDSAQAIRSLSPSAHWLERKLLEARIKEAELRPHDNITHITGRQNLHCGSCKRLSYLDKRLTGLGK